MLRLVDVAKRYLAVPGKERQSAAVLLSKVLTRPDVVTRMLPDYITWVEGTLKSGNSFLIDGALLSLTAAFRDGRREDLLGVVDRVYPLLAEVKRLGKNNVALRKLWIKLTQRVGLCYLKPRVAAWRYQRGLRVLMDNTPAPPSKILRHRLHKPQVRQTRRKRKRKTKTKTSQT